MRRSSKASAARRTDIRPLAFLGGGTLSVLIAYGSAFLPGGAPAFSAFLLMGGTAAMLVGLMDLGASTRARTGPAFGIFLATGLWIVLGFAVVLVLPAEDPLDPQLLMGLPLRAAILIYGVGLAPALFLPWAYARIFEQHTLSEDQLQALRVAGRRVASELTASEPSAAGRRAGPDDTPGDGVNSARSPE